MVVRGRVRGKLSGTYPPGRDFVPWGPRSSRAQTQSVQSEDGIWPPGRPAYSAGGHVIEGLLDMLKDSVRTQWTAVVTIDDPTEANMHAVAILTRGHHPAIIGVGEATLSSDAAGGEAAEDLAAARALRDIVVQLMTAQPSSKPTRHCTSSVTASHIVARIAVTV